MSHTSSIKSVQIKSVSALRAAVQALTQRGIRCTLEENATPRAYYNNQQGMGQAPFVLRLPDAQYDVGFYAQPDGTYEARTDFFGGSVAQCIGGKATTPERRDQAQLGLLFQEYSAAAVIEQARMRGQSVVRRLNAETNKLTLEVTGPGI